MNDLVFGGYKNRVSTVANFKTGLFAKRPTQLPVAVKNVVSKKSTFAAILIVRRKISSQ